MTLAEIKLMFYTCTVMVISSHYSSYALISLLIQSVFFSSCCCNAFVWKSPHSELSGCSCIKAEVRKCTFEIVHPKTKMYYPFTLFFFSFENTRRCFEECQKPSTSIVGKQILWQSFKKKKIFLLCLTEQTLLEIKVETMSVYLKSLY